MESLTATKPGEAFNTKPFKPTLKALKGTLTNLGNARLDGNGWGILTPRDVQNLVLHYPNDTFILDVRASTDAETSQNPIQKRRFKDAKRFIVCTLNTNRDLIANSASAYEVEFPAEWERMLKAEYVVIHCDACTQRSPAFIAGLQDRLLNKQKPGAKFDGRRNPNQKVGLMQPGWGGFYDEKSEFRTTEQQMKAWSWPFLSDDVAAINAQIVQANRRT
ncbi:hypothetical protein OC834_005002 [Tilletia horrida]|uniref:Uncharacterized protein n=1 Tax=Tilletia horrida TaxID=155126 RepID=A0AAN6GGI6_9BASI|nr:hypothetical protein OC835_005731 [Tilletia horrida]KAK0525866.1 hypothetical protein OC834_005002 [Tilletia horrida]KAK0539913.1 hypothetical protein OC842_000729 [Tilletia horrida]KAK0557533.1 hypothetical protein OC844_005552 [Tilletia horrida]